MAEGCRMIDSVVWARTAQYINVTDAQTYTNVPGKDYLKLFSLLFVIFIFLLLFVKFYCKYHYTKFAQCLFNRQTRNNFVP